MRRSLAFLPNALGAAALLVAAMPARAADAAATLSAAAAPEVPRLVIAQPAVEIAGGWCVGSGAPVSVAAAPGSTAVLDRDGERVADTAPWADGPHTVTASVTGADGSVATLGPTTVVVDTGVPKIAVEPLAYTPPTPEQVRAAAENAGSWLAVDRLEWAPDRLGHWKVYGGSSSRELHLARRVRRPLAAAGWVLPGDDGAALTVVPWDAKSGLPLAGAATVVRFADDGCGVALARVQVLREGESWVLVATAVDHLARETSTRVPLPAGADAQP